MLLKCALNGADANWGRVLCAVGYSQPPGFQVDPATVSVTFKDADGQSLELLVNGEPRAEFDEAKAKEMLEKDEIIIQVQMGQGQESATYYTCDLSKVGCFLGL
jgi:glutamate N-acetyltransferase/amino-acid N-acetyltransferase